MEVRTLDTEATRVGIWILCTCMGTQSSRDKCNRGKTPGKQVQHASACGTAAAEIRHFLAVEPGLTRFRSVFARGFAPVTGIVRNLLKSGLEK